MYDQRLLIVNADDFGLSPGINAGIIAAHERGIVTSASLMVRYEATIEAVEYARANRRLGLGLHVDLGEWYFAENEWACRYELVDLDDAAAVHAQVLRQWELFRQLVGRDPDHVDSHQHVHRTPPASDVFRSFCSSYGVPLRHFAEPIRYCGDFYGQTAKGFPLPEAISRDRLLGILNEVPEGITELACHPGLDDNLDTMYRCERRTEVERLCDSVVRDHVLNCGIRLITFPEATALCDAPAQVSATRAT